MHSSMFIIGIHESMCLLQLQYLICFRRGFMWHLLVYRWEQLTKIDQILINTLINIDRVQNAIRSPSWPLNDRDCIAWMRFVVESSDQQAAEAWGQWGLLPTNSKSHGGHCPHRFDTYRYCAVFFLRTIRWLQAQPNQRSHLNVDSRPRDGIVTSLLSTNNEKNTGKHHASCSKLCLLCTLNQVKT